MSLPNSNTELPLNTSEKIVAGVLMILAIIFSLLIIIIHWPNKMPTADDTIYCYKPFNITLIEAHKDRVEQLTAAVQAAENRLKEDQEKADKLAQVKIKADKSGDNALITKAEKDKDSIDIVVIADIAALKKANTDKAEGDKKNCALKASVPPCETIQFGVLILILVAASGFLGNLVHVASSFTAFVGAEKFKRSWTMWYVVKPFTAAGLAVFLYMALNSTAITPGINLNGILATATLTGLFTDIATQKLKEIFTAAFKPKDNLPNKLDDGKQIIDVENILPKNIDVNQVNNFIIHGQNLDPKNIIVNINGTRIDPAAITITPTLIKFSYTVAVTDRALTRFTLLITDIKGVKIDSKIIDVV